VNLVVALTVFAAIFPAELPDKTFVATLVLSTRFPPLPVWLGAAAAFVVQTAVAVVAGGAVSLLPDRPVHAVTAALFAIGAAAVLLTGEDPAEEEQEVEAELEADLGDGTAAVTARRAFLTTFAILFIAEWGDLTQILTAAFAAKYHDVWAVSLGATAALWTVAALGVIGGRAMLRVVPVLWVRRVAAAVFAALAVVTAIEAVRG
jgi:putative Ca2+/H+ antiporter (TMEM165/GDT1 family)